MNNRGGKRNGAGRKSKAEEQELIERLKPLEDKAFNKLDEAIEQGQSWALKLFMQYRYGQPKQFIEQSNIGEGTSFDFGETLKILRGEKC